MHTLTRRDFLNGAAIACGSGLTPARWLLAGEVSTHYPPALTGMRGSTNASYAAAHALRDGKRFAIDQLVAEGEVDLLVVGAGISGLAAAYFFRQQQPHARILILDNHDDFGGHARRCELRVGDHLLISYGGSESIQSPAGLWSDRALALLQDLGVNLQRFDSAFDRTLYPDLGLSRGLLFTRAAFGADKLVTGDPTAMIADDIPPGRLNARTPRQFVSDFPLHGNSQEKLVALYTQARDFWPQQSVAQKMALLSSISYREFLTRHWGLDRRAASVFQQRPHDFYAVGIDLLPALEAFTAGYPGFDGMHLPQHPRDAAAMQEPYIYHFPDGNASIARLLVRKLIPGVAAGHTMTDIVMASFDYSRLDTNCCATRLRLHSTVIALANIAGNRVAVGYLQDGRLKRVHARRVVYAGYNMMLPYLAPELGRAQRQALSRGVKAPLVYVKLAVRNWQPWVDAGVHEVTNTMGFYARLKLDYPVSLGGYRFARTPRDPICLHLVHVPITDEAENQRTAWRAGRQRLYEMSFADFEAQAAHELTCILGKGFNFQRDVTAMSVYRWAHGYAYGFNSLFDKEEDLPLQAQACSPIGRIAIAGSDAAWSAYAHAAIDEAARAVGESI